jgi:glutamine---fructose-6-phosphate transaminase (isomerizing)
MQKRDLILCAGLSRNQTRAGTNIRSICKKMNKAPSLPNRPSVSIETMQHGISNQADLISGVIDGVGPQVKQVIEKTFNGREITNIFIVGCGDSYYSALGARLAFEKYSGYRVEMLEALEFSRYSVDYLPQGSLVIGISAGGDKTRPTEALRAAKRKGAWTIAISGTEGSPITRAADLTLLQNEKSYRAVPPEGQGTFAIGNYLASTVVLYLLALELGRHKGTLSQEKCDGLLSEIRSASGTITQTIAENQSRVTEFARSFAQADSYQILGGGPNYATALFMAAKLFEMPQVQGVPVELEEWAHEQYFLTRPRTPILVVVPPGKSVDRAREQMMGAKEMGATVVAICDPEDAETQALADTTFPIMGRMAEEFSPLTYCIPGELFAVALSQALNKPAFSFISPRQYEVNMHQIRESHMRDDLDE